MAAIQNRMVMGPVILCGRLGHTAQLDDEFYSNLETQIFRHEKRHLKVPPIFLALFCEKRADVIAIKKTSSYLLKFILCMKCTLTVEGILK